MMSPEAVLRERLMAVRTVIHQGVLFPRHDGLLESSKVILSAGYGRPDGALIRIRRRRVGQKLRQSGQSRLKSTGLEVLLVDRLSSDRLEEVKVAAFHAMVIIVAIAGLVACLADPIPESADRLMLC